MIVHIRDKMPPQSPPKPRDAAVATLLRRAHGHDHSNTRDGALNWQALLVTRPPSDPVKAAATITTQQLLIQEIYDTEALNRPHSEASSAYSLPPVQGDPLGAGAHARGVPIAVDAIDGDAVEQLVSEFYELHAAFDGDRACLSTNEQRYAALLSDRIVSALTSRVMAVAAELPHTAVDNRESHVAVGEACSALLTLSVKPTALAREIAFTLLHELVRRVALDCALATGSPILSHTNSGYSRLQSHLFAFCADMLTKSIAVAGTTTPTAADCTTTTLSTTAPLSPEYAWLVAATACLAAFLKQSTSAGTSYRLDRLVKLDTPTTTMPLLRASLALASCSGYEAELQNELLAIVVSGMYAQRSGGNRSGRQSIAVSAQANTQELAISMSDVDKVGGLDVFLSVFYSTPSEASRRLLLVLFFDLSVEQLKRNKPRNENDDTWAPSYESLLGCLQSSEFATLVTHTPLSFASSSLTGSAIVKTLHAAVENDLLEKHVVAAWSALRALLQIDEYFGLSASLANTIHVLAHTTSQQQPRQPHDSLAERVVAKTQQLISSPRAEEAFKGARWLAELLSYGLSTDSEETSLLGSTQQTERDAEPLDETSLCFDEGADMRLCARTLLYALAASPHVAMRLAFARVLRVVMTRRRLHTVEVATHAVRDLNPCLQALVAHHEESVAVLTCVMETLLSTVVVESSGGGSGAGSQHHAVPYVDIQRQKYDTQSCDVAREVVGALVGSDSLAASVLRGVVCVDLSLVAEISIDFLLHILAVLEAALDGSSGPVVSSHAGDYAVVAALLVSYAMEQSQPRDDDALAHIHSLAAYLDACDTRIAVILARTLTALYKRHYGEVHYMTIVRELHASAVESDDDAVLANVVTHARALLRHAQQMTP